MTLYEVNIEIRTSRAEEFAKVVENHMRFITNLDGFLESRWLVEENSKSEVTNWVIQYWASSQKAIDDYLGQFAPALRKDAENFIGDVKIHRRNLKVKDKIAHQ